MLHADLGSFRDRALFMAVVGANLFRNKISSYPTGGMLEKNFTPSEPILLQRQRSRHKICNETV
jgi:hypothetical protein